MSGIHCPESESLVGKAGHYLVDPEIPRELVREISCSFADLLLLQKVEMVMKHFVCVGSLIECWERL